MSGAKERVLMPGDYVATSEEFIPGYGTYEERGKIFAAITGHLDLCMNEMTASILPRGSAPVLLEFGDTVIGCVVKVVKGYVYVEILGKKGEKRALSGDSNARLHISNMSRHFVKDTNQSFSENDIIRAKVIRTAPALELSTADDHLGIIMATCHCCANTMEIEKGCLLCRECKIMLRREITNDYGNWQI